MTSNRKSVQPSTRKASISSDMSSPLDTTAIYQPHHLAKLELERLNSRFSELCNQIEEEQDPSNDKLYFNFITWEAEKNQKIKFDPQVVSSKLKQVENKLEMSKANMELDKRHSPRKRHIRRDLTDYSPNYKEFYEKGLHKGAPFEEIPQNRDESNDESDEPSTKPDHDPAILHYHDLKQRPKFLGYLLKRVHSPTKTSEPLTARDSGYYKPVQYERALAKLEKNRVGAVPIKLMQNPEEIIQKQYPKFFNRVNDSNLSPQIREKPTCRKLISIHEHLIDSSPEISDENRRKLQQKLNHIVKEIAKGDRYDSTRRNSMKLPRLQHNQNL